MWRTKIIGKKNCLKILNKNFSNYIISDSGNYYLVCPQFETLDDKDFLDFAEQTLRHMLSMINLHFDKPCQANVSRSFENIRENGTDINIMVPTAETTTSGIAPTIITTNNKTGKITISDPLIVPINLESYLKCIKNNDQIRNALYFNDIPDWHNLYKVYEIIEYDMGGKSAIVSKKWATDNEIDLFKCTAHNVQGSGLKARHAVKQKINQHCQKILSSQAPMELGIAKKLIKNLLNHWIDFKC